MEVLGICLADCFIIEKMSACQKVVVIDRSSSAEKWCVISFPDSERGLRRINESNANGIRGKRHDRYGFWHTTNK